MATSGKIPVTVLTGFLGSGKTTLLNRILTENHGLRIAVIENEFGEVGVDQQLVIGVDEEVFEMNNGCICCTVRGDLIRVLANLKKRKGKIDRIVLETTGMADPGPVAQTFFIDEDVRDDFFLDGIVTLVDAKHVTERLADTREAREQIAFADLLVLNKCDLVEPRELEEVETRLRRMNAMARILRCERGNVPVATVLDVGGFDLDRALATKPAFLEAEYPFEWAATFEATGDAVTVAFDPSHARHEHAEHDHGHDHGHGHGHGHDHAHHHHHGHSDVRAIVLPLESGSADPLVTTAREALVRFHDAAVEPPVVGQPFSVHLHGREERTLALAARGTYAIFTEPCGDEMGLELAAGTERLTLTGARHFRHEHSHAEEVSSMAIAQDGNLDREAFEGWLGGFLREHGPNLYRLKGVFAFAGVDERVVLQAVHMVTDSGSLGPWGSAPRRTELVLIGKDLPRAEIEAAVRGAASSR